MTWKTTAWRKTRNQACDRCDERLSAYLDGEAGAPAEIESHLHSCPECRRALAELEDCSRLLAVAPAIADPSFVARFRQRLDALETERAERWRMIAIRLMPLAATALVAALALTALESGGKSSDESFTALERTVLAVGSPPVRESITEEAPGTELLLAGAVDSRSINGLRRADLRWP
ncbi:MAG TPA: zf-HC2 domain-containing protein [Thermoanaerobaculia bacterium]|nr:zf-HC2 domain-containing protein [Thermoanaerobaculia bacterium]